MQLYRDVLELKKPATVPIAPWIGLLPFRYFGHTAKQAYYDYEIFKDDWYRFHEETRPDGLGLTLGIVPGKLFDILDYHLYDWPGHGTPEDTCYQYSEQEWMKGDEYDALIQDPGSYWQRTLPAARVRRDGAVLDARAVDRSRGDPLQRRRSSPASRRRRSRRCCRS